MNFFYFDKGKDLEILRSKNKEVNWVSQRERLKDVLPLETPLNVKVEVTRACNFKCCYCYHASKDYSRGGAERGA